MMLMLAVLCIILSALINQYVEKGLTVRKLGILVGLLLGFVVVINLVDRLAPDMLNILFNKKNFMDCFIFRPHVRFSLSLYSESRISRYSS